MGDFSLKFAVSSLVIQYSRIEVSRELIDLKVIFSPLCPPQHRPSGYKTTSASLVPSTPPDLLLPSKASFTFAPRCLQNGIFEQLKLLLLDNDDVATAVVVSGAHQSIKFAEPRYMPRIENVSCPRGILYGLVTSREFPADQSLSGDFNRAGLIDD